jgi:2-polyprenyl-3-methyl-5-hydroxy-6-metoxy-1,4-benzoquinol methylase
VIQDPVLREFAESGLALDRLSGNSAKLRLSLDLAARLRNGARLRVLDVGCAGPDPLNLWEPFVSFRETLAVVGVDIEGLDRVRSRAQELGFPIEVREGSALALVEAVDRASFDAVVSTQVLEHLRDWRAGLRQMAGALKPGGVLYLTCDSGELARSAVDRARLAGKRVYAVAAGRVHAVARLGAPAFSGQWERGPQLAELREAATGAGLDVERLERYCLHDVKTAQRHARSSTRQLWLALEEALCREAGEAVDPRLYGILYLRARRPAK